MKRLFIVTTLFISIISVTARGGRFHWFLDWLAIFHHYYFGIGIILLIGLIAWKAWRWILLAGFIIALNGILLLPYLPLQALGREDSPLPEGNTIVQLKIRRCV